MTDYSWTDSRAAGALAHISSLPSRQGIGSFGKGADLFMEFLAESGFKYWQVCPLAPTGYGDSPYQSFSSFAGNTYFIDYHALADAGLLGRGDAEEMEALPGGFCDYGAVYETLPRMLRKAAAKKREYRNLGFPVAIGEFAEKNAWWLDGYAEFMALKKRFGGRPWSEWPDSFKFRRGMKFTREDEEEKRAVVFGQWVFDCQYRAFREKLRAAGLEIIGDVPIFVSRDSADVWANPGLFELEADLSPRFVAGVGPDYFSPTGQLWGNPLYRWDAKGEELFRFWERRLEKSFEMYDVLRIDHFRGFADYWEIPAGETDASKGRWRDGPGKPFFARMRKSFPREKFIAEDLGILSDKARRLVRDIRMPNMAVLQFAFGGGPSNPYLPHNLSRDMVCYTGTHDNDTSASWYASAPEKARDQFRRYFSTPGDAPNWTMTLAAMTSVCKIAVIPMQDILGLGAEARMNTPGRPYGNWQWRMTKSQLEAAIANQAPFLRGMCELSGRLNPAPSAENA